MLKHVKRLIKLFMSILAILIILIKADNSKAVNDIKRINRIEIYDSSNKLIYWSNNYHESSYTDFEDIPNIIKQIFVYSEDKRFYSHSGFDIYRIINSLTKNSKSGASTITQQYVKNLYFTNARNIFRKIKELYLSIRLEQIYTKDEILQGYLNTIYFGHSIYGITDAARFYFNKELDELSIAEICVLANIIKNPTLFNPIDKFDNALLKRNALIKALYSASIISSYEMSQAQSEEINIYKQNPKIYSSAVLYFKDIVLKELTELKIKKDFNQVISIYTNYNTDLNKKLQELIDKRNLDSNVSLIAVDKNGYYLSTIGGKDYNSNSFNIAIKGQREIASTIKPLLYYEALKSGYNPLTSHLCNQTLFKINNNTYSFSNYHNIYESVPIPMGYALATSDNIYALKTHVSLGLKSISRALKKYDISSQSHIQQAIGNISISLNKLLEIYYSFQSLGNTVSFKAIKEIHINDKRIYKNYFSYNKVLNSDICYILNDMMTYMFDDNLSHNTTVTGKYIAPFLNGKAAGKSGLDDYNSYMIGFNKDYLIGAWTGYINHKVLSNPKDKAFPKTLFLNAFNQLFIGDSWYEKPNNVYGIDLNPTPFNKNYYKTIYFLKE